jgi:single-strand DNA-binding protein
MNIVCIIGRLVRDPEVRWSQGKESTCIAKLTVAVDRRFKKEGEQSADFIPCTAFGKTAEFIEKYVKKGTKVVIQGRWQTGSYDNKEGQKVYTNDCIVESIEFAESKKTDDQTQNAPKTPKDDDFMNLPENIDDEVPFG